MGADPQVETDANLSGQRHPQKRDPLKSIVSTFVNETPIKF
jgi:hypothetical protein